SAGPRVTGNGQLNSELSRSAPSFSSTQHVARGRLLAHYTGETWAIKYETSVVDFFVAISPLAADL
ncbi:hypothetical protein J6590_102370, partial [Homalodisca vitripennis]